MIGARYQKLIFDSIGCILHNQWLTSLEKVRICYNHWFLQSGGKGLVKKIFVKAYNIKNTKGGYT